jgi:hypothetical protein
MNAKSVTATLLNWEKGSQIRTKNSAEVTWHGTTSTSEFHRNEPLYRVSKLNGKTSGIDYSYRDKKKTWVWKCIVTELRWHVLIAGIALALLKGQIALAFIVQFVTCDLITCVTIVTGVSHFIPSIRTCWHALSKYTLGQLCNYTFPGPMLSYPFLFVSI